MVEYIKDPINHLSWQVANKSADLTESDYCGDCIIAGTKAAVSIWKFLDSPGTYDQLPIAEMVSVEVERPVCKVKLLGNLAFVALTSGTVILYELATHESSHKELVFLSRTSNLHPNYKCNDLLFCPQTNSVITCGNDGAVSEFNVEHNEKVVSRKVSDTPLKCMDKIDPNQIICGSLNGNLKMIDRRIMECVENFSNQTLSSITCVQRNPYVNHLVIGGNDQGSIMLYDLRNQGSIMSQMSAHSAAITDIRYRPRETDTFYSSSCVGELFKWNTSANQISKRVEAIGCLSDLLTITSFDVNYLGDLIYTTDHGAIFYHK